MKILIYYPFFSKCVGGGEYLPLVMAHYWQDNHDVTIATGKGLDFDLMAKQYGVALDPARIRVYSLKPSRFVDRLMNYAFNHYRSLTLQRLASSADLCISCWDMIDFGRPGCHFMCISDFDPAYKLWLTGQETPESPFWRRIPRRILDAVRDLAIVRVRTARQIMIDPRERIFPNSQYVANAVAEYYGRKDLTVFYPPTIFEPLPDGVARRNDVVCVGRISPSKRIDQIIRIVEQVRERTRIDLTLKIAGYVGNDVYCVRIVKMAKCRPWVKLLGAVVGEEKKKLLVSSKYAVHARTDENFGISVTEYLKAGVVPLVPIEGGAGEVVANDALTYASEEEAVVKFSRIVGDGCLFEKLQRYCRDRGSYFAAANYLKRQNDLLDELTGER